MALGNFIAPFDRIWDPPDYPVTPLPHPVIPNPDPVPTPVPTPVSQPEPEPEPTIFSSVIANKFAELDAARI